MIPLKVKAHLAGAVALNHPLMLDALLMWAVAAQEQRLPPVRGEAYEQLNIPIKRSECGRYWLCSQGQYKVDGSECRYKNRRAPWKEYATMGTSKIKRVQINLAANKSYRVPYESSLLENNEIVWWCIGSKKEIKALLSTVHYIGKYRGSGSGLLQVHGDPWTVEECEPWTGFPVLRDSMPTRPLPLDAAGLSPLAQRSFRVLDPPYFDQTRAEIYACPV